MNDTYIGAERATTRAGRTCDKCGERIETGEKYLHIRKNRHIMKVCGGCLLLLVIEVAKENPALKADALTKII